MVAGACEEPFSSFTVIADGKREMVKEFIVGSKVEPIEKERSRSKASVNDMTQLRHLRNDDRYLYERRTRRTIVDSRRIRLLRLLCVLPTRRCRAVPHRAANSARYFRLANFS